MKYENRVARVQSLFVHTLPDMLERWQEEGYRIINTNQSKTFSGEEEIVIFLERKVEEKEVKTNFDRIKSMSVEEMAMFLVKCDGDMQGTTKKEKQDEARDIQQWLLQEVSE